MKKTLLFLIALLGIGSAWAWDFSAVAPSGQTLYYYIISATDQTCGVTNNDNDRPSGTLVIPAEVEYNGINYSVTTIGGYAFHGCNGLTSVTIPNSVTRIGDYAFYGCSGLTSVTIPNSVTTIGELAFFNCSGLTSVTIPNSVTSIGYGAFAFCSGLTSVSIPNSVETIGASAFQDCSGIRTLDLGDSLLVIQNYAFKNCNALTHITIPESLTYLGRDAFNIQDGYLVVQYNAIDCEEGYIDWDNNYVYNPFGTSLRTITFGDHVSWIPVGLCASNPNLTQVNFSNSTHLNINSAVFYGCTGLTSIVLPNSVDTIAYNVFYGCTNITSLTLGEDLKWVGDNSFSGMTSLSTIICRGTEPAELNNINVFEDTPTNNIEVIVPCNTADTYRAAYGWNTLQNYSEQLFHTLTVRSADNTKGSVSILVQPDCQNLQAQFQASAYNGFHFDHWSDGNTDNPRYLVLTQDTVLEAIFLADGEEGISDLASAGITVSTNGRTIALAGTNGQMLSIYDVTGRVIVREKAVEGKAYTMPNAGVYMVKVGSHKAEKVVVVR